MERLAINWFTAIVKIMHISCCLKQFLSTCNEVSLCATCMDVLSAGGNLTIDQPLMTSLKAASNNELKNDGAKNQVSVSE